MTVEMWMTLFILAAAIGLFITEKLRVDVVALGVVVTLMLTGILTTNEALAGFASPIVLTIASLFVIGGAILQTGVAATIASGIVRVAGQSETRLTMMVMIFGAAMSGFMSDTGVVAVMLPTVISMARSVKIAASRLLLPLAYGSLLGGAMTLIGTPPNIVVADLLRAEGMEPFGFFSFTPVGLILAIAGILFMLTIGRRLLPEHTERQHAPELIMPHELLDLYELPDGMFRLRVRSQSPLRHHTLASSRLRSDFQVNVLEVLRRKPAALRVAVPTAASNQAQYDAHLPRLDEQFLLDDILIVQGDSEAVSRTAAYWNLGIQPVSQDEHKMLITHEVGLAEVIIRPRSALIGRRFSDLDFNARYKLTVLDIRRPDSDTFDIKSNTLRMGDMMLVQGSWEHIFALKREHRQDFIVMGETEALSVAVNRDKAWFAVAILLGMLFLMISGVVSVAAASMLAALAMILTGCLTMDDAYKLIDWKSIVLIAGMLPMSTALEKVGLVDATAMAFTNVLGDMGPMIILGALFLFTSVFTQVLSNTATAVLVAPIAFATAESLGVQPFAFLMAVAIAASMAFASPVASPVNTLVMGAGNYRFKDYMRVGIPLIFLMMIVSMLVLPILWPLH